MVRIVALKAVAQRFSFLLLIIAAFGLMTLGKIDTALVDSVRGVAGIDNRGRVRGRSDE